MKTILFMAAKYSSCADDTWLSNDLVEELARQDCSVTVVAFGDRDLTRRRANIAENMIKIDPRYRILKYLLLWPKLFRMVLQHVLARNVFDQIMVFAPVSVMWPAVFLVRFLKSPKKTVVMFDIYPVAQVKIGALPACLERPLKFVEKHLLAGFSEITAMGGRNKSYIEQYYATSGFNCRVKTLNLWGRGELAPKGQKNDDGAIRVVFGGQIIKGREVDSLIDLFGKLRDMGLVLELDIYSKGPDFAQMKERFAPLCWLSFQDQLPRNQYISRLASYDVGAIVTDRNADLPTFPSKIIDYVEAGLKSYCLVEEQSELYSLLGSYSAIHINPFSLSAAEITRSFEFFSACREENVESQIQEMRELFSVKSAAARLLA